MTKSHEKIYAPWQQGVAPFSVPRPYYLKSESEKLVIAALSKHRVKHWGRECQITVAIPAFSESQLDRRVSYIFTQNQKTHTHYTPFGIGFRWNENRYFLGTSVNNDVL